MKYSTPKKAQAAFAAAAFNKFQQDAQHQERLQHLKNTQRKTNLDYNRQLGQVSQKKSLLSRSLGSLKIAGEIRKDIENGDLSKFFIVFVVAMAKDGFLDFIPVINIIIGIPASLFLVVSLWGKSRFMKKQLAKRLIIPFAILIVGNIPIIQIFTLETFIVYWIYRGAKKHAEKQEEKLEKAVALYAQ